MAPMSSFRSIRRPLSLWFAGIDKPLLFAIMAMGIISAVNLYGIGGADHSLFRRQLVLIVLGLAVMAFASVANYRYLKNYTAPVMVVYIVALSLLASSLVFGAIRNIRAWIIIGGFTFEPSELAKLAFVILMAKYFSQRHVHINQFRHIIVSGIYCAIPTLIILAQPDLGSAVIILIVWAAMLLSVGINKKHLFVLAALGLVLSYVAWIGALAPYQKERVLAFINPYQDPTGYGYHIIQSQVAIGSGHWFGQGLGRGSQSTLGFLPEPYNDFAFAALAEQFGLAGVVVVLGLMGIIVWRILGIGERSTNNFARLFCVGIATVIFAHVFINTAVNIGLLPITGLPFSFLSYGGSHLLSLMVAIGFVQSIHRHG